MKTTLTFWRQRPDLRLAPAAIAQELLFGNEVDGLIDLPVQEVIARLKESFPGAIERAGELVWLDGEESFEATWTWQHFHVDGEELSDDSRSRLIAVLDAFDCPAFDAQLGVRLAH